MPYLSYNFLIDMSSHLGDCFPRYLFSVSCLLLAFFNGLNLFCKFPFICKFTVRHMTLLMNRLALPLLGFTKLFKKIKRKLSGQEDMTEMKDLDEELKEE